MSPTPTSTPAPSVSPSSTLSLPHCTAGPQKPTAQQTTTEHFDSRSAAVHGGFRPRLNLQSHPDTPGVWWAGGSRRLPLPRPWAPSRSPTAYRYQDRYPPTSNHLDDDGTIDICFWDSTELKLTCVPAPPAVLREPTILLARAEHHNDNQIQTTDVHRHKQ